MEEKRKILFCITKGAPFGGAQKYVYDLATNLPSDKYEVVVACGEGDLLKERLKEGKIRVIDLENSQRDISLKKDWLTFKDLLKVIKEEKPDVVHLNSSKIGLLGALAVLYLSFIPSFHHSIKVIFTGHAWAFNENRNLFSKTIIFFLHWLTVLLSHTTIAVSEKARGDLVWLPFIKNKVVVVHNGIDKFEALTKKEAREFLADEGKRTVIFSLSQLHPSKGVDVAIKAIGLLPEKIKEKIIYCIAGEGQEKKNLEELATKLGIVETVRFLGFVENGKKLLHGADIFLLPSRTEAFPYVILEAGLAGLPIVATSVGGVPEVIRDMQNGILVQPRNPKEIAEAIMYLLDHKEKQKEFGVEIKKTVSNFFSLQKMLKETYSLYGQKS